VANIYKVYFRPHLASLSLVAIAANYIYMLIKGRREETTRQHTPIVLIWTLELSRELSIRSFYETLFVTIYDSTLAPLLSVRYYGASSLHAPLLTDGIFHAADDRLTTTIVSSRQLSRTTACSLFALDTPCTPSQYFY
jgi:hypothetical protein